MTNIKKFQKYLKKNNIDYYIINRTDEFLNEYISAYAERLKWITGFTGSAGRAIISQSSAILFVDGRYTFQVKQEINKKDISLKHINNYWAHLKQIANFNVKIAVDYKLHSIKEINHLKNIINKSKSNIVFLKTNPIDKLWKNQPKHPNSKIFDHPIKYAGIDRKIKINKFQAKIKKNKNDFYILSSLDSIAWLLNIRGSDINMTPLAFANLLIPKNGKLTLFCEINKIEKKLVKKIKPLCNLKKFHDLEKIFGQIPKGKSISMDYSNTPYYFKNLSKISSLKVKHLNNPCTVLKAVKNSIELKGAKKANIRDGVSVVKFIYWLKNLKNLKKITEIKAANYLLKLRKKNRLFYSLSFDTISAAGKNAALPHYRVSKKTDSNLENNNIYLIDSGAQYKDGTTDITRTIILGRASKEIKDRFTRVLKGHIAIANHKFKKNTTGAQIDYLARQSLNEVGCDYDHGTGHGIGSFLNVHEGPQRIAKKTHSNSHQILDGMIISNEPGYYKENDYGIRIENLIIVKKIIKNFYFETISFAPVDIDLIDVKLLNKNELMWINKYHSIVFKKLNKFLNLNERIWLKNITKPL